MTCPNATVAFQLRIKHRQFLYDSAVLRNLPGLFAPSSSSSPTMATQTLNFRLATPSDAPALETLINTAFQDDKTAEVFLSADHASIDVTSASSVAAQIARPDCAVLVATTTDADRGAVAAHCSVRKNAGTAPGAAWLGLLAVDVGAKNRGLGTRMLAHAEDYVRRAWGPGVRRMELSVVNTRAGLASFYERRGYRFTGETTPFPYDGHGAWRGVLRDDLYFRIMAKDLGEGCGGNGPDS